MIDKQNQARDLRAAGWTMPDIAAGLEVSRSSVSLWTRDVPFEPRPRQRARRRGPNRLQVAKQAEIDACMAEARAWVGALSDREFLMAGAALYAGEGTKRDGSVGFPNSDPRMIAFFLAWLRHFFAVDETRLRVRLYLHEGLDLAEAVRYWTALMDIPDSQFRKPYRAKPDPSIRKAKHPMGCPRVVYSCSRTHRTIMGLVEALLACRTDFPG